MMQTIQLQVDDSSVGIVMTLIESLKKDIVYDAKVIETTDNNDKDISKILKQAKGLLKGRINDPVAYQRELRKEWERDTK